MLNYQNYNAKLFYMPSLISTTEFCERYHIEYSFITSLEQSGLIHITKVEETPFIDTEAISELEKYVRLHYDLDINVQGIEAIIHLLQRVEEMKEEINALKNRLSIYE